MRTGETIAQYPDDQPYPSQLLLGYGEGRALHVVVSLDAATNTCVVITVYEPDAARWDDEFRHRRST